MLVLSQYVEMAYAVELLGESAEGVGYLLKDRVADGDALADAVRQVGQGGSALDPEVVARMLDRRRPEGPLDKLSPREREVLGRMAEGQSNQAIAERPRHQRARGRAPRLEHLHQARAAVGRGGAPARAGRS